MFGEARCLRRSINSRMARWGALSVWSLTGCIRISIAPSCPEELEVGQSGMVAANERNPGAIPTYRWEVFPPEAGVFLDPQMPVTMLESRQEGEVVIRLTASDGLFQVIADCQTTITTGSAVVVSLEVDPDPAVVGETTILLCSSVGGTEATTRTLEQIDGDPVTLTVLDEGAASFTPDEVGELTFRCVGESGDGRASEPSVVTVSVTSPSDDTSNENGGARPGRPGRGGF